MSQYHEEEKQQYTLRLRALLEELPPFLGEFFRGIAQITGAKTRVAYAYDLKLFFTYLVANHPDYKGQSLETLPFAVLEAIDTELIERFLEYTTYYQRPDYYQPEKKVEFQNDEKGKARKLAAIRSMYRYFLKKKKVSVNPAAIVSTPKIHEKQIIRLEANEVANLLDEVESGEHLTKKQQSGHEKTKTRDLALVSLLLGTGMRVSECVGIDRKDLDFEQNGVLITRKGGNQVMLYFNDEVREALLDYLQLRNKIEPKEPKEDALFLSTQRTRLCVRAVQLLVKKYTALSVQAKKITPHKLRSTYGTNLYQETGDIYLVADVLGHADVNTTKKHYAAIEENRRKRAAKVVKLRKE